MTFLGKMCITYFFNEDSLKNIVEFKIQMTIFEFSFEQFILCQIDCLNLRDNVINMLSEISSSKSNQVSWEVSKLGGKRERQKKVSFVFRMFLRFIVFLLVFQSQKKVFLCFWESLRMKTAFGENSVTRILFGQFSLLFYKLVFGEKHIWIKTFTNLCT